jgi:hypothetical protein
MTPLFKEWQDAISDIWDVDKVARLGYEVFLATFGQRLEPQDDAWNRDNIAAFASLLNLAFRHMRLRVRRELRKHMTWRGEFFEPALWEDPRHMVQAHATIEQSLQQGEQPTLLELLVLAHDLEAHVRTNLLRLLWIAEVSDGTEKSYASAMLKPSGEQGSIRHAIDNLRKWIRSSSSRVLDIAERKALRELIASIKSTDPDQINLDDFRNWVAHRDFLLGEDDVILHFHGRKGSRMPLRIAVPRKQVTLMRHELLGLISLLMAFKWMFRVHEAAPAKRRQPVRG